MGMYEEFFGFRVKPFELVPNPDFMYLSGTHKKAITYLDYGINEKIGFILVTGEVGSGKTTIIRDLIKKMDAGVVLSKVFNTRVNSEQLISMINDDFGLNVEGKGKVILLKELYDFLIEQYAEGMHPVLIIDEAQNLTPELLEEVRMLSNLETDRTKLLQIIMVGQPELRNTLAQPALRQLRQRISISCHILPLTLEETMDYVFHRLEVAGNRNAVSFADGAFDIIYNFSRGVPRIINIACDFLLLTAYVEEAREVSVEMVNEVVESLESENRYWQDESPSASGNSQGEQFNAIAGSLDRIEKEICRTNMLLHDYINGYLEDYLQFSEKLKEKIQEVDTTGKIPMGYLRGGRRAIINALRKAR
jgi:putative secretion ATPase (PEP-CTERM system associated)